MTLAVEYGVINEVDRNIAPSHLPKQGFFYIPHDIAMVCLFDLCHTQMPVYLIPWLDGVGYKITLSSILYVLEWALYLPNIPNICYHYHHLQYDLGSRVGNKATNKQSTNQFTLVDSTYIV